VSSNVRTQSMDSKQVFIYFFIAYRIVIVSVEEELSWLWLYDPITDQWMVRRYYIRDLGEYHIFSAATSLTLSVRRTMCGQRTRNATDGSDHVGRTLRVDSHRTAQNTLKQNTNRAFENTRFGGTTRTEFGVNGGRAPGLRSVGRTAVVCTTRRAAVREKKILCTAED